MQQIQLVGPQFCELQHSALPFKSLLETLSECASPPDIHHPTAMLLYAVLRAQTHVRFGGNHSYPPTHTTFSPEVFADCWLLKSHEVHTVVVVSADASGFKKECRSPVQWGGGGGSCQRTVSNCMRWGQDRPKLSAARKAQIPFRRGRECKKLSSGGSRNEIWQVEFKSRTNKSISVSSGRNG